MRKALDYLAKYEFAKMATSYDRLKALEVMKGNGVIDHSLAFRYSH